MRHQWKLTIAVAGILAVAAADISAQEKRALFVLGGGYTAPNSEVRDHLGDGYHFNIGAQFNVSPIIGIEGLYSFNGLGDKRISIPVSGTPGGDTVSLQRIASLSGLSASTAARAASGPQVRSSSVRSCSGPGKRPRRGSHRRRAR